jgi:imidazolonepropionase-like amidohydrolase
MTAAGKTFNKGFVFIENGKILIVDQGDMSPPKGTRIIDVKGRYVTPGLIDAHSHMGLEPAPYTSSTADTNEWLNPLTPFISVEHGITSQDPAFERAVQGGVTTIHVLPGSTNLIGGLSITLKLHRARLAREMNFPQAPYGMKMACGENPKWTHGEEQKRPPSSRMTNIGLMREIFILAKEYEKEKERYKKKYKDWQNKRKLAGEEPLPPPRNLSLENLLAVLKGKILVHMHCYTADDMVAALELAKEFGFQIRSFEHGLEAYKIRDILAKQKVGVSTWTNSWGFKMEAFDGIPQAPALLTQAGVKVAIHSDSPSLVQRLNQEAAKGYYAGIKAGIKITEDQALKWITANPAWILGIHQKTGTLEKGKMADIVVWSKHPFSVYSKVDMVFIDGKIVYNRFKTKKEPWSDFELGLFETEK